MGSVGERIEHYSSNMRLLVDKVSDHPGLLDTSELLRPEAILKEKEAFRDYTKNDALGERVKRTYTEMHTKQTIAFVMEKHKTWLKFNHMEATIMEALDMLNELVDESDPDLDLPNIVHAFQTAERIREEHPDKEWFQLVGLIHDLGKIMAFYGEPQWAVVGDTFPVGCKPQPSIVFGEESFQNNPDTYDSRYNTKLGPRRVPLPCVDEPHGKDGNLHSRGRSLGDQVSLVLPLAHRWRLWISHQATR